MRVGSHLLTTFQHHSVQNSSFKINVVHRSLLPKSFRTVSVVVKCRRSCRDCDTGAWNRAAAPVFRLHLLWGVLL